MTETPNSGAEAGEQPGSTEQTPQDDAQQPETGQGDDYKGAGSKDALKADLARERDARQALAQQLDQFKAGLAQALGIESEQATPDQLAEQLTAAQAETASAKVQLAVFRAAPAGVDANALLDSQQFLAAIGKADPADVGALSTIVTDFVAANPRFRTTNQAAGARDAAASTPNPSGRTMDDWIRGR